ncbi:protein-serine O-palmitoleoyltransferase porcupine [Leptidea sinapis]|uniref:protein-serine O-palmitoleoyltransferase porcupine n=1 Tax=Leptidea sinapis TaxID=189913 RepID=UPI002130C482|nr:protein-serine O-palmitoleoyltransferase porcupine [Leptidea sinapis]
MDDEDDYTEDTWSYLTLCIEPTVYEGLRFAKDLILANFCFRFILQYSSLPQFSRHSISLLIGSFLLYLNIGSAITWVIGLTFSAYTLIFTLTKLPNKKYLGAITCVTILIFLLTCELYLINPKKWQQIRGIQMIVSMKIISVAIEMDRNLFKTMLNPIEFFGYILCPANCMLGPWISYHNYEQALGVRFLSKRWIKIIALNLLISVIFLVLSNCVVPWYISDNVSKWLMAYRDAQAFRMSHYFISSLSVVSMVSAGFGLSNSCHQDIQITNPFNIEIPRSLVQVVIFWNIPMHQWLKNYVFRTCQPLGQFFAILFTYIVSSLLHGCNFQLSAVLLSIGTFSYVEYNLRYKISSALEACCLANPCIKQCEHKHNKNSLLAIIVNSIFSFITVMHLAYLGVMFEASFTVQESGYSFSHTMGKWENLNFFNHGFTLFMYIIYVMM